MACYGAAFLLALSGCTASDDESAAMMKTLAGKNRLAQEKSPYLLQHAGNPVDWYPWGEEAFARARTLDKPIFLSIGYSTCHWCHVMAHESFENDTVAAIMNELFVNIKLDREERPDVDQIYMRAVQALTRSGGGWPLSVFLTPDRKPFFGGTYFPPEDRYGRAGFPSVLRQVSEAYRTRQEDIVRVTDQIAAFLAEVPQAADDLPPDSLLQVSFKQNLESFDRTWGGFGGAPKFPRSMALSFLMRYYKRSDAPQALAMVTRTLDGMANGGMYDHLGGGFHRYSTDERWLVPHFEKMLYDNALLARTYLEAYQLTGRERYAAVAREIFGYLMREMRAPGGGLYSAQDADSEGEEGKFYVWSRSEVDSVLGDHAEFFCACYDVTSGGNFEGANILWTPNDLAKVAAASHLSPTEAQARLAADRARLLSVRGGRIWPHRDEKVLSAWNGLALGAFAFGYQVLGDPALLKAAGDIASFLESEMWDGRTLKARWADGEVRYDGYLDDYAFVAWGLLDLYESTFDPNQLKLAFGLMDAAEVQFAAPGGGYYFAPAGNSDLLARPQEVYDGALPSGNSIMVLNLLKRSEYTGDPAFKNRAVRVLKAYKSDVEQHPASFPQMLCALDFFYGTPREVVIVGTRPAAADLLAALRREFSPNKVVLLSVPGDGRLAGLTPLVDGKEAQAGKAMAYVCRDFTCRLPTADPHEMLALLR